MTIKEKEEKGKALKKNSSIILDDIFDNYHKYNDSEITKVNNMCQLMNDLNKELEHYDLENINSEPKKEKLTINKAKKRSIWVRIFGGRP